MKRDKKRNIIENRYIFVTKTTMICFSFNFENSVPNTQLTDYFVFASTDAHLEEEEEAEKTLPRGGIEIRTEHDLER